MHGVRAALVAGLIAIFSACIPFAPAPVPGKVLRLGVDLPLTGPENRAATQAENGIRFYVATHPTLDGFTVVLDAADDASDPTRGTSNVDRFITEPSVLAVLGPFDASVARKIIPVANSATLAIVSPATSNPCLTRDVYVPALLNPSQTAITCRDAGLPSATDLRPAKSNNFFRLTTTDDLQGAAAADFAVGTLHVLRVAVISDHEAYGQGLAAAFTARLEKHGGTVVGRLDADPSGSADVAGFLAKAKDQGAQAVYYGGGSRAGCAVRAAMAPTFPMGEATPFLGGDGIAFDPECVRVAGENAAGVYATVPIVDASTLASAAAIVRAFSASFPGPVAYGPYTMVAYDATAVVYSALDRAISAAGGGIPSRDQVIAELARTSGQVGVTGILGFDPAGDTTNRVLSIFESTGPDPRAAWKPAGVVDYSSRLPY